MKAKRLLFLAMVICLANEAKAQFYDGPDDIFYYLSEKYKAYPTNPTWDRSVCVFNFDGKKACQWGFGACSADGNYIITLMKDKFKENPNYFEDAVETADYDVEFVTSHPQTLYQREYRGRVIKYYFSSDREEMTEITLDRVLKFKRVEKSFFKTGRSRKPSSTLHE